jgi:predicted house-cleaning noncanonical NTP pyrophosphatase (MazG superfamily)
MQKKLVRDNIPQIIKRSGKKPVVTLASQNQMIELLKDKLLEEAQEVKQTKTNKEIREELADVLQVIISLSEILNIPLSSIEEKRKKKLLRRGSFSKRYVLENIE